MESVLNYLKKMFKDGDTVVLGVSGGPDSMALLSLVVEVGKQKDIKIVCAHVNHNLRVESFSEEVFVKDYCEKNNVIFEYMLIENYGEDNFHNEARTKRYTFFESLIKKYHANYLFTAHHADDLMETILMRIVRGSTLRGYSGFSKEINKNGYKIIRPLIEVTKQDIMDYLSKIGLDYAIDKSNFKDVYTRNRFRKNVLPFLKQEDSHVHEKFIKFSNTLIMYDDFVCKEAHKYYKDVYNNNSLNINKFKYLDDIIKEKILSMILEELYSDDLFLINDRHLELILSLIETSKVNTFICLPNEIRAVKSYDYITFNKSTEVASYEIELNEVALLPNGKKISVINDSDSKSNYVLRIDKKEITLPIYIRTRMNGDKIATKGMKGKKKVNDIFTDAKISKADRDLWPIVTDSKGEILWVPGLNKSKYDKQKNEFYDIILKYD